MSQNTFKESGCRMKIDRLVSIIMLLLDKERIGAHKLADMFEVSPRTIYRDIEAISMAGIPVCSVPGVGGGFEIPRNYKIDKKVFSSADLSAILTGLSGLSSVIRGDELANALAKVKSFIPADKAQEIELEASRVYVDLRPWLGSRNVQPSLELIQTAMRENRLLAFEYADRHGSRTVRTAEPYQLVLKGNQWYFQGYCHERKDFRLFKIARTSGLRLLDETFVPRVCPKPQLDFPDTLAARQTNITVRFHASLLDRVLEYCADEQVAPDGEGQYVATFPFIENDFYYSVLLGFGDRCECLKPRHVRAELQRRVQAMAALYENRDGAG